MKIAIDISPIKGDLKGHKVRGVGFYLEYLKRSLLKYHSEHQYVFFTRGETFDRKVDIVHYPYFEPFFVSLSLFEKYKRVITVHDLTPIVFPTHFPAGIKGNLAWQIQKLNLQKSQRIITDSNASQKDITKIAGVAKEKIDVAYLAAADEFKKLESGKWSIEIRKKYQLPEKFVLCVGDVTWNKNLPRFIKVMKKIKLPLVLVGKTLIEKDFDKSHPWNKDLVEVQKLTEGDSHILKLGFVPTDDLVAFYNLATVFVMPSVYEGFGLPVLEAMQSGCPVITTDRGSLAEVANNAAYIIDGYSEESIAKGVEKVFSSKDLQNTLIKKGFEQAKHFTWKKTAEQTILAYKKVVEGE